jgi:uncharacterized protein YraI
MNRWGLVLIVLSAAVLLACQLEYVFPTVTPSSAPRATRTRTPGAADTTVTVPTIAAQSSVPSPSSPVLVSATAKENLRVRAAPSTSAQQVGSLNKGDSAQVVGRTAASDWWQIVLPSNPNARGWILANFAEANGPIGSVPVVPSSGVLPGGPPQVVPPPSGAYPPPVVPPPSGAYPPPVVLPGSSPYP